MSCECQKKVGFLEKYIKPWFFDSDNPNKIKPNKVAISVFLILIIVGIIIKFCSPHYLSDGFMGILLGMVSVLIGAATWRDNSKDKNGEPEAIENEIE